MTEESKIQNLKNKHPDFFNRFSPEFLDFVFSEETSMTIAGICLENGIEDEEIIDKITFRIALVLFDQVPKENLAKMLEKGAGLNPIIAEKVSFEAEEHIFSQVPESQPTEPSLTEPENISIPDVKPETGSKTKTKKRGADSYREPIE